MTEKDDFQIEADVLNHAAEKARKAVAAERAMVLVVYDYQGVKRGSMGANGYKGETEIDALTVMAWDILLTLKALMPIDSKITISNSDGDNWTLEDDPQLLKKMVLN